MKNKKISHYRIIEKIGEGGMSVVYKAEDINLKRTVALKFLSPTALENEQEKKRFIREAQAEAAIEHPNICAVHEIEEVEGETFIAMAYIEGENLVKRIERGPLGITEAIDVAIQVSEGLQSAHESGVIHRDIKPANIMLTRMGHPVIMDFGLARLSGTTRMTKTGTTMGTVAYMSPEQIKGDKIDHRTDIWSLGITLYDLLTGRLPFSGDYDAALLYAIVNEAHTPITQINKTLPPEVEQVIGKALQKNVEDRYPTMQEMIADLKKIRRRYGTGTHRPIEFAKMKIHKRTFREIVIVPTIMVLAALAIFILVISPRLRKQVSPVTIAVLDFDNQTDDPRLSATLTDLLLNDLAQRPNVQILRKELMRTMQREMAIEEMNLSTGLNICRHAKVQYAVAARVLQIGENFRIDANVYDVTTTNLLFAENISGRGENAIFYMTNDLSKKIRTGLHLLPEKQARVDPSTSELFTSSKKAYEFYQIARDMHSHGDLEKYVILLEQAIGVDSTFVKAYQELAIIYDYYEDSQTARKYARKAEEHSRNKNPREYRKSLIIEYQVNGNVDRAIEFMKQYLAEEPNDVDMHLKLGYNLNRYKKEFEEAITHLNTVIELDPENLSGKLHWAYNFLGHAYLFLYEFDKTLDALQQYQSLAPNNPDPYHSMADAYRLKGNYPTAIEKYSEIISTDPDYVFTYEGLGLTYLAIGKWKQALSAFSRYCNEAPESKLPYGHRLMGWVHLLQEDYYAAKQKAEIAIKLDPHRLSSYWLRGMSALLSAEGLDVVKKEIQTMEELTIDSGSFKGLAFYHHLRGRALLAEGKFPEGLRALHKAVKTSQRDESIYFRKELARGYLISGMTREAIQEITSLLLFNDNDADVLCLLGEAYAEQGSTKKSEQYFRKAANIWRDAENGFIPLERITSKLRESPQ